MNSKKQRTFSTFRIQTFRGHYVIAKFEGLGYLKSNKMATNRDVESIIIFIHPKFYVHSKFLALNGCFITYTEQIKNDVGLKRIRSTEKWMNTIRLYF